LTGWGKWQNKSPKSTGRTLCWTSRKDDARSRRRQGELELAPELPCVLHSCVAHGDSTQGRACMQGKNEAAPSGSLRSGPRSRFKRSPMIPRADIGGSLT
jgi:hypothetical protein